MLIPHRVERVVAAGLSGLLMLAAAPAAVAQTYHSGQNLQPVFEGWVQNPDGTFDMLFGYLNRNYEEELNIPVGPDNFLEPGDIDQGQPTYFYPRRQRFSWQVTVPADWGDKELVWTVTAHGRTDRAVGWLVPEQIIDEQVIAMNRAGGGAPEIENDAPTIELPEGRRRTVAVGETLSLTAVIADDGVPAMRPARNSRPPGRRNALGLRLAWIQYRGPGDGGLRPVRPADGRPHPGVDPAPAPRGRPHRDHGRLQRAGHLRHPGDGRRRLPLHAGRRDGHGDAVGAPAPGEVETRRRRRDFEQQRALLRRQAGSRFGAGATERLAPVLERIADPERLAGVGDLIVRCGIADELLARADAVQVGRSMTG